MRDEDAVAPIAAMNDFGFWSAGLCAFAFFALAIWLVRRTAIRRTADKTLVAALLLTAAWGVAAALAGGRLAPNAASSCATAKCP